LIEGPLLIPIVEAVIGVKTQVGLVVPGPCAATG